MIDIIAAREAATKLDVSFEELAYLYILYKRDITSLLKYMYFTPETKERNGEIIRHRELSSKGKQARIGAVTYVQGDRAARAIGSDMIDNLLRKNYIKTINHTKSHTLEYDNYDVTSIVEKYFLFNSEDAILELIEEYPKFITIDGKNISLTVLDIEEYSDVYAKAIKSSIPKHKEVLEIIRSNKDNINFKLENFIKARSWESLKSEKKESTFSETL